MRAGTDKFESLYPAYNGYIAYLRMNGGEGAFR